jgi:hypothetical protein
MIEIALRRRFSKVVANPRVATGEEGKTDRGWQDKAGFPASGTSFLSSCLHIVLGRSPTFRRDERAALFPIIILFQRSESRRPRHAAIRRWPPAQVFPRWATQTAFLVLRDNVRLPIVVSWCTTKTTFASVPARSAIVVAGR